MTPIFLEDIADKLEETMEHWEQYLNKETSEFVAISDGAFVEIECELEDEIESSDNYIRLPNQYDINEYNVMEDFAKSVPNHQKREKLLLALNGRKPFRSFKDALNYAELDNAYYAFRYLAFVKIAKRWCEVFDIPYKTREEECKNED